jgi:hypothetical protein
VNEVPDPLAEEMVVKNAPASMHGDDGCRDKLGFPTVVAV